ncbi:MAG: hypothetical protein SGJ11_09265 [Phycisphaerae bacterium]|nr:hypothetical protein [Phycisphaerae bacterium]
MPTLKSVGISASVVWSSEDFEAALGRNGFDRAQSVVRYEAHTGLESEGAVGVILVSATKGA